MQKKDIYNYLAQTYLSETKENRIAKIINEKKKKRQKTNKFLVGGGILALLIALISSLYFFKWFTKPNAQFLSYNINLPGDKILLSYNFIPEKSNADRLGYTINLNSLNAKDFKYLTLSAKKIKNPEAITLRIDLENLRNEFATVYVPNINKKRQDYKIELSKFKQIKDFSNIEKLIFTVERWNANPEKDSLVIDNLSFVK
jgi:hypothetical protein